jgi:hypothetical protein
MNPRGLTILMTAWVLVATGACGKSKGSRGGLAGSSGSDSENSSSSGEGGSSGAGGASAGPRDAGPSAMDAGLASPDASGTSDTRSDAKSDAGPAGGSTSSSAGAGGRGGGGGSTSRTSAGGSTSKPDAGTSTGPCRVDITAALEPSLLNLVPGDSRTLRVNGIIQGTPVPVSPTWQWTVKGPDQTILPTVGVTTREANTDSIQFALLSPGTYDISVSVSSSCRGHTTATAIKERSPTIFVRVLPPPSGGLNSGQTCSNINRWCPSEDAVPYEDRNQYLETGLSKELGISLVKGDVVTIDPMQLAQPDPTAFPPMAIPSTIKVAPHNSTWTIDGTSTNDRPFLAVMHPLLKYDVLVVPSASGSSATRIMPPPPPFRIGPHLSGEFLPDHFSVTQGVTVQGTIRVAGAPLMGARVLLRAEASDPVILPLPSTWGSSDSLGAYSVRARGEALFSVILIPPVGTTLPQVTVPGCIDLRNIEVGSTVGDVDFIWNTMAMTNLNLMVAMPDGQAPVPGVQVRLQSKSEIDETTPEPAMPTPGKLTINGDEPDSPPSGNLRLEAITDQTGTVIFGAIPKGHYHLVLVPPDGQSDAAITAMDLDLRNAGSEERRMFPLSRKVNLTGRIMPKEASSGGRMVATDAGDDILGNSISSLIDSDGNYTLMADPGRTYRFSVEPAPGKNLPTRIPLYGVTAPNQNARLADRALPTGLKVSGAVKFSNKGVPGAIVQAYCQQSGLTGCVDPANPSPTLPPPLVEIATQADGSFTFYLLDPGKG